MKHCVTFILLVGLFFIATSPAEAQDKEVLGVRFAETAVVAGKQLTLNGVGYFKKFGFLKVYVVGLYLETPSRDARQIIESEQVKYMVTHYLTDQATAKRLRAGFVKLTEKCNPPEAVARQRAAIDRYAGWIDADMADGTTSETVYIPGQGLTLTYKGEVRGTIAGADFAQLYYRNSLGEQASETVRDGLLGGNN